MYQNKNLMNNYLLILTDYDDLVKLRLDIKNKFKFDKYIRRGYLSIEKIPFKEVMITINDINNSVEIEFKTNVPLFEITSLITKDDFSIKESF